jgi:hypothetical protein
MIITIITIIIILVDGCAYLVAGSLRTGVYFAVW